MTSFILQEPSQSSYPLQNKYTYNIVHAINRRIYLTSMSVVDIRE